MEFSLYNWGNDQFEGENKYELLLEGAKFADENGFCAVWTPERHFHAFGGLYPNPSVTGAAVAAVTKNLAVRAGSIVSPLHHPIRIAEEWAVIDNLTGGRVGLSIASGWQPNDFVLKPENTPPNNKPAMFEDIKTIRKLWAGEAVEFPTKSGEPFGVITQPRPLSKKLPIWVTTAGNPETWKEAGTAGANILTHLLGQSIEEVAEKTALYHTALRVAGYDPEEFTVTLMLHTFVGADRETVRKTVREPMKDYLRSAAGLIKQYAWAFPAFKKPKGVTNPFEINLDDLSNDEMEGVLDYAFERYFEDAGLFGTVEDCLKRVEQLKQIGVGEIGCLVDYGMSVETVLEGLVPLAQVLKRANTPCDAAEGDYSIAAQIQRHGVTHLQCTPSMARMLVSDEQAATALKNLKHLMIGGEPLPGSMISDFAKITSAEIQNMYGPTETTIWSSSEQAQTTDGLVNIGHPIANTQLYVLDTFGEPVPVGTPGELYISGAGVTRGYWNQPELTNQRFLPNPFLKDQNPEQARMYRTGDMVCWRDDGKVEFLGRVDNQVKLRGHRIELGEIEAGLEARETINQAVVVTHEFGSNDVRLVAYLVTNNPISEADLRENLSANLPDYMVPSHFVTLDEIPLTPNKKVDKNALPAPTVQAAKTTLAIPVPSEDTLENQIAAIWSRILGVPNIASGDNFFELGGHSLLAVQAHREIKSELGVEKMSITDFFRFPTLSALAGQLASKMPDNPVPAQMKVIDIEQHKPARNDVMSKRKAMRARRKSALS
jgi:natural product biosynthesis luciferase-like monooxygenase protein